MRRVGVIVRKEVTDNLRDRRSLAMALFFPLLGPLTVAATFMLTSKVESDKMSAPVTLPVRGEEHAPGLIEFLRQHRVTVVRPSGDLEAAVKSGTYDVALVVPPGYGADLRAARPATVRLIVDRSRHTARSTHHRVERLVEGFGGATGKLRLLARGVDPAIGAAVAVETVDVSTAESRAAMLLAMLPMFLVMALFVGGFYIAIDTTAGELERGSLEPLFINPARRWEFVVGKFLAALIFSIVGLAVATVGFGLVPRFVSTEGLGLYVRLEPRVLATVFVLVLPLAAFATAVQMIVATFSRGFKEAQTLLSFLLMLPMIPGILLALVPFQRKLWMMLIPVLSEQVIIHKLIRGEAVEPAALACCAAATTLAAAVCLWLATRLYRGERMFARAS
jgi:sodium transport system permease protein